MADQPKLDIEGDPLFAHRDCKVVHADLCLHLPIYHYIPLAFLTLTRTLEIITPWGVYETVRWLIYQHGTGLDHHHRVCTELHRYDYREFLEASLNSTTISAYA